MPGVRPEPGQDVEALEPGNLPIAPDHEADLGAAEIREDLGAEAEVAAVEVDHGRAAHEGRYELAHGPHAAGRLDPEGLQGLAPAAHDQAGAPGRTGGAPARLQSSGNGNAFGQLSASGSGGGSPANQIEAADTLRDKGIRRVGPYQVTRCMSSTVSACLATNFKVKGINYSITSACSTSAHCIGAAAQQIAWGMQDVMFAGGGEELSWGMSLLFDGMGAMSSKYNETPEKASRAYDANRDGFVIAGGGGAVVLESLEHALARGQAGQARGARRGVRAI